MNNMGAGAASGDLLVFLNDDVTPIGSDWLGAMVAQLERPEIGVAGARLLYPGGDIQHAGIVLGIGQGTGHAGRHLFRSDWWKWLDFSRDVSAVTGACLGVRRDVFTALHGFDEAFPVNYNDVDFCLRCRQAGYWVICEQRAVLRHQECASRSSGTRITERREFFRRWGGLLVQGDPYYNPALADAGEQIEL
jgi:GT2 family glycosyltransferase